MKKKIIIILLICILVVAGVGGYFVYNNIKSTDVQPLLEKGKEYEKSGDIENAKTMYEKAIKEDKDFMEAYVLLLNMYDKVDKEYLDTLNKAEEIINKRYDNKKEVLDYADIIFVKLAEYYCKEDRGKSVEYIDRCTEFILEAGKVNDLEYTMNVYYAVYLSCESIQKNQIEYRINILDCYMKIMLANIEKCKGYESLKTMCISLREKFDDLRLAESSDNSDLDTPSLSDNLDKLRDYTSMLENFIDSIIKMENYTDYENLKTVYICLGDMYIIEDKYDEVISILEQYRGFNDITKEDRDIRLMLREAKYMKEIAWVVKPTTEIQDVTPVQDMMSLEGSTYNGIDRNSFKELSIYNKSGVIDIDGNIICPTSENIEQYSQNGMLTSDDGKYEYDANGNKYNIENYEDESGMYYYCPDNQKIIKGIYERNYSDGNWKYVETNDLFEKGATYCLEQIDIYNNEYSIWKNGPLFFVKDGNILHNCLDLSYTFMDYATNKILGDFPYLGCENGFLLEDGSILSIEDYDVVAPMFDGIVPVADITGKYGYVNKKGEEIIPCIFQKTCSVQNGKAWVQIYDKYGVIDINKTAENLKE